MYLCVRVWARQMGFKFYDIVIKINVIFMD